VTLSVSGIEGSVPSSLQGKASVPAFAYSPGSAYCVDGLFSEWTSQSTDPTGDVLDRSGRPVNDADADIASFGSHDAGSTSYHYVKVNGAIASGAIVPGTSPKNRPQKGPVGVNMSLPKEELTGEDRIYVLLDTDNNTNTGFGPGSIGADNGVLVLGREGRVLSTETVSYSGDGSSWKWTAVSGDAKAAASGSELELSVGLTGRSYFYIVRWSGDSDSASAFRLMDRILADPYIVEGYVTDENGHKTGGILVQVCDDRTHECLVAFTDSFGYYQVDFATLSFGYQNGDGITVTATNTSSGKTGVGTGTVTSGGSIIDVTIPEIREFAVIVLSGPMLLLAIRSRRPKGKG